MGTFDDASRFTCKLDGGGFLGWALRRFAPPPALAFDRWDDTRRVSPPGWPDRTDDLIAVLRPTEGAGPAAWMIVESETDPDRFIFHRLGVYGLLLAMELARGVPRGSEPEVGLLLLNLSGQAHEREHRLSLRATGCGLVVSPLVISFREIDAAATLDEIAARTTAPVLLPWVPLMAGGGKLDLIERWKTVAQLQPDAGTRGLYRDLALVFAELTREQVNWQQALEGWEMRESTVIQGWIKRGVERGRLETCRVNLLKFIRAKLQDPVSEDTRLMVEGTTDPDVLERWYDLALSARSVGELLAVMRQGVASG